MLSAKNLIFEAKDVPDAWVFSNYCGVPLDQFNGTEFKIKSIFTEEKTPSMGFFLKNGKYLFNDFSSGNKGDCLTLVKLKYGLDFHSTCTKIVNDYNIWRKNSSGNIIIPEYTQQSKYKVTSHEPRKWNLLDKDYWIGYNIGSTLLTEFIVKPLESYTMTRDLEDMTITGNHIYGYFKRNGQLFKIYQPKVDNLKFIKVGDHIQGSEQTMNRPFLVYSSSLKDLMSLISLRLNLDSKAPDSENTFLPQSVVELDINTYQKVLVLFDNDSAGQKAAYKYQDKYGITPVFLNYGEKDLSDHIKVYGAQKTKQWLVPLIDRKLNE
ncbi:MAG TPA: hypothetical protein VGM30_10390 [Puia sp.]|jgi:DNA primase